MNAAQEQMIEQQVRAWHTLDGGVLALLRSVSRERFVPPGHAYAAFADAEVPLPQGQHMLRPSVVGRLLQALALGRNDSALEIGAGSGFVTACLARACRRVRSIELFAELAELSRDNLLAAGASNAQVITADARELEGTERFDVIAVTASLPLYDSRYEQQLLLGGRLFVVVGRAPVMEARLVRRVSEEKWTHQSLFETVVDPLVHATRPEEFAF
jgi:protein-L-isoaspartate(D-aspartate) O-methyltransferase